MAEQSLPGTMNPETLADYVKLRAANDAMREQHKADLFARLTALCESENARLTAQVAPNTEQPVELLRTGIQPWEFQITTDIGSATMVGERCGVRYRGQTLLVEIGWPREPKHGFIPAGGLARGRVSFSPNPRIDPLPKTELVLTRTGADAAWHELKHKTRGAKVDDAKLREYLQWVLTI